MGTVVKDAVWSKYCKCKALPAPPQTAVDWDVNAKAKDGRTLLHRAAGRDYYAIAGLLRAHERRMNHVAAKRKFLFGALRSIAGLVQEVMS